MALTGTLEPGLVTTVTLDGRYYAVEVATTGAEIWVTTDGRNPDYQPDISRRIPFGRTEMVQVVSGATPTIIKLRSRSATGYTVTPVVIADSDVTGAEVIAAVASEATLRSAADAAHAASETAHIGTYVATKRLVLDLVGDYGAAFDNVTDDTAAWVAALADAKGATTNGKAAIVRMGCGISKVTGGLLAASGVTIEGHGEQSIILLTGGSNKNILQSENYGSDTLLDTGIYLRNFQIKGNEANQAASVSLLTSLIADTTVSAAPTTLPVVDTTGFDAAGTLWLGSVRVTYTGKTGTSFTGVTAASSATMRKGCWITPTDSEGHLIALQAARCRIENVFGQDGAGSGLYFQGAGTADGLYGYENVISGVRFDGCRRFGLEVGEGNSDGQVDNIVVGDDNLMGGILIRSADWAIDTIHVTGIHGTMPLVPQALLLCANDFRATGVFFDSLPGTGIVIDSGVRGGGRLADIDIAQARYFKASHGSPGGHGVLFRGPGANGAISRVRFSGFNLYAPVAFGFCNGPWARTVGSQDLAALVGDKLQVISALDFAPSSDVGGVINISTDELSYTGRQMSQALTTADAASGAGTLNVDSTDGFDSAGTLILLGVSVSGVYTAMAVAYTGKTATTFTGCTGITTDTPGGAGVSQHFFTGVTGGTLVVPDASSCFSSALNPAPVSEMIVSDPIFRSFQVSRFRMQTADDWHLIGGVSGGKKMTGKGTLSIAAGSLTGTATHGLAEAPTTKIVTPTADTQGLRYWATADATTLTVTVDSPPITNPVTFDWRVELV